MPAHDTLLGGRPANETGRESAPALDPHAPARIETATYVLELASAAGDVQVR
jgi:hypothetical protein